MENPSCMHRIATAQMCKWDYCTFGIHYITHTSTMGTATGSVWPQCGRQCKQSSDFVFSSRLTTS